jgi:hypothetical protein
MPFVYLGISTTHLTEHLQTLESKAGRQVERVEVTVICSGTRLADIYLLDVRSAIYELEIKDVENLTAL